MTKRFKDESNKRLYELAQLIEKTMDEEERGFIFAPMVQPGKDHRTAVFISDLKGHSMEETFVCFWATMASIIMNVNTQVPENLRDEFRDGFLAFERMVKGQCFVMEDENER